MLCCLFQAGLADELPKIEEENIKVIADVLMSEILIRLYADKFGTTLEKPLPVLDLRN